MGLQIATSDKQKGNTMDRARVKAIRTALIGVLAPTLKEMGLAISGNMNATYDDNSVNFKLSLAETSSDGSFETEEAKSFKLHAAYFGLPEDMMDKTYIVRGRKAKVLGIKPRARKYPLIFQYEDEPNKRYKTSVMDAKHWKEA